MSILFTLLSSIPFEDKIEEPIEEAKVCGTGRGSEGTRLTSMHNTSGDRC